MIKFEGSNENVDKLLAMYAENPLHAKVYYGITSTFVSEHIELDEQDNGHFTMVRYRTTYLMDKKNVLKPKITITNTIIYDGLFWLKIKGRKKPLTVGGLHDFANVGYNTFGDIISVFTSKFPQFEFVFNMSILYSKHLNIFVKNDLTNAADALKFFLKIPRPTILKILKMYEKHTHQIDVFLAIVNFRPLFKNLQNLGVLFTYFKIEDFIKKAWVLNHEINCSWTLKKIEAKHAEWDIEVAKILLIYEQEKELKIRDIYKEFAEFSGFELYKTNKDLIFAGYVNHNCIGGYDTEINNGSCALLHTQGYTFELRDRNFKNPSTARFGWGMIPVPAVEVAYDGGYVPVDDPLDVVIDIDTADLTHEQMLEVRTIIDTITAPLPDGELEDHAVPPAEDLDEWLMNVIVETAEGVERTQAQIDRYMGIIAEQGQALENVIARLEDVADAIDTADNPEKVEDVEEDTSNLLYMQQIHGKYNCSAPERVNDIITSKLREFNKRIK